MPHLNTHNLFSSLQSAYRPGHSTETAFLKVVNDLLLAIDEGKLSVLVLLDLSAVFDTIDRHILLHRLQHVFGIQGTANLVQILSHLKIPNCFNLRYSFRQIELCCRIPQSFVL